MSRPRRALLPLSPTSGEGIVCLCAAAYAIASLHSFYNPQRCAENIHTNNAARPPLNRIERLLTKLMTHACLYFLSPRRS